MVDRTRPAMPQAEDTHDLSRAWALVVEPDASIGRAVSEALSAARLDATVANDGVEALFAVQNPVPPALVVLDWEAERHVSAERLFALLRRDPHTQHVPVIVLADAPFSANWFAKRQQPPPEAFLAKPLHAIDVMAAALHLLLAQDAATRINPAA